VGRRADDGSTGTHALTVIRRIRLCLCESGTVPHLPIDARRSIVACGLTGTVARVPDTTTESGYDTKNPCSQPRIVIDIPSRAL